MGLLNRKPKTSIEEFCQQFYDSVVFHPIIAGEDFNKVWWGTVFDSVAEADHSFASIDPTLFRQEMTALRIELFGLAWMHHLEQENCSLREILFTKSYLEQKGQLEIWDIMSEYNKAIAHATELPSKEPIQRDFMPLANEKVIREASITFIRNLRTDLLEKWSETGVDRDCAARVANRLSTSGSWSKGIAVQMLTARLADRLGCDINLNSEALFRLSALVYGLYNGAKEAFKSVNLQV